CASRNRRHRHALERRYWSCVSCEETFRQQNNYGLCGLSSASYNATPVATPVITIAISRNRLRPALSGRFLVRSAPAPAGPCAAVTVVSRYESGSRITRYAVPSGTVCVSPSTVIERDPRVLRTTSSFEFTYVTCATVGASVPGRISAVEACSTNAFAFAVENTAVPCCSVAPGVPFALATMAELAADSINLAAPARICKVPVCWVLSLSPLNT